MIAVITASRIVDFFIDVLLFCEKSCQLSVVSFQLAAIGCLWVIVCDA